LRAQQSFLKNIQQGGAEIFHINKTEQFEKIISLMQKYQSLPKNWSMVVFFRQINEILELIGVKIINLLKIGC